MAAAYLSPKHRDDHAGGCMIAALAADIARRRTGVRGGLTLYLRAQIERMTNLLKKRDGAKRRQQAINRLCSLVGSIVLARAVDDSSLSDEILAAVRTSIEKSRYSRIAPGEK